ncbi:MAG TPA: ATP-binding protein [Candidatus Gracilibacteria bacterium]|nr:ATP-binding protein [Candidatus Gracilibacteria bacterium]
MDNTQPQLNPTQPAAVPVATPAPVAPQTPVQPQSVVPPIPSQPVPTQTVTTQPSTLSMIENLATRPIMITITLPTNAYFLSGIRDFTLGLIKNMTEFSEQWAFRFQSVVDELCNNAIEYGSTPGQDIKITFISVPHQSIEIHIEDTGTGKNKVTAADLTRMLEEKRKPNYEFKGLRGRGLAKIVAEWSDELVFEDTEKGGIRVKIKKMLNDPKVQQDMAKYLESPNHLVLS